MSDRRQHTYTTAEKVEAAYRILISGHSKKSVSAELGMSRVTLRKWCAHPDIIRRVEAMRDAAPAPEPAPEPAPVGGPVLDDMRKRRLLEGLRVGMPLRYAMQRARLNPEILSTWNMRAAADVEVRELLQDIAQAAGEMVFGMYQTVLAGGGAGRGAQWVLSKFDRDAFGERPVIDENDGGLDGYSDEDLAAIVEGA